MQLIRSSDYGFWLLSQGSHIHLVNNYLPEGRAEDFHLQGKKGMVIGELDQQPLWLVEEQPNDTRAYFDLRDQLYLPERTFNLLNRGVELNHFFKTHQFCGKCGDKTIQTEDEWAVQCTNEECNYRTYPVICPSIIVAIRRGKEILLANHRRHAPKYGKGGMYTTLAGFVEVGESFEQTIHREVFEETGIKVRNIRYFGSQPWAFPNSQMVGFLADYESGEIRLQEEEIADAKWFRYDEPYPEFPEKGTIARALIEATLQLCAEHQDK
ncbi:NAD(+) diphosphatase [Basfia succiniciproducens]|uniref:NAD-capped RNA hydrolase NudC n=1 Tax=Basfia succiniciproducens TaxID=653940 RepID=A0A1G5B196_9PAST|nr:NAD(+) diphosphatase [Basfia succiniciproducens]QIM69593.1 NADH pyrophosphatase [Basfia succiniciproducens]SCX83943.1 NAD+ diphosphatase [Basfia succiniciproducens]